VNVKKEKIITTFKGKNNRIQVLTHGKLEIQFTDDDFANLYNLKQVFLFIWEKIKPVKGIPNTGIEETNEAIINLFRFMVKDGAGWPYQPIAWR